MLTCLHRVHTLLSSSLYIWTIALGLPCLPPLPLAHGGGQWLNGLRGTGEVQGRRLGLEVEEEVGVADSAGQWECLADLACLQDRPGQEAVGALAAVGQGARIPARQA